MIFAFLCEADAAVKIKNSTETRYEEQYYETSGDAEDAGDIATLENDIRILDEEIAKCKKQKKGWIAATVIGAAGTVATGVAAGVQGVKLRDKKDDYREQATELGRLDRQKAELDKQIKAEKAKKK